MVFHYSKKLNHLAYAFRPTILSQGATFSFTRNAYSSSGSAFSSNVWAARNAVGGRHAGQEDAAPGSGGRAGGAGGRRRGAGKRKESSWGFEARVATQASGVDLSRSTDDDHAKAAILSATPSRPIITPRRDSTLQQPSARQVDFEQPLGSRFFSRVALPSYELARQGVLSQVTTSTKGGAAKPVEPSTVNDPLTPPRTPTPSSYPSTDSGVIGVSTSTSFTSTQTRAFHTSARDSEATAPTSAVQSSSRSGSATPPPLPSSSGYTFNLAGSKAPLSETSLSTSPPLPLPSAPPPPPQKPSTIPVEPPLAHRPLVRRNSTSTGSAAEASASSTRRVPMALEAKAARRRSRSVGTATEMESRSPEKFVERKSDGYPFVNADAAARHRAILDAVETRSAERVLDAIRLYRAVESTYSTHTHNAAIRAVKLTHHPSQSLAITLDLYNEMLASQNPRVRPDISTYRAVIGEVSAYEVDRHIKLRRLRMRMVKRELANRAFGDRAAPTPAPVEADEREVSRLEAENPFELALRIYRELGHRADELGSATHTLMIRAAGAQGRPELALALYDRLECSSWRPLPATYEALIAIHGRERDAVAVKLTLEDFLARSAEGRLSQEWSSGPKRNMYRRVASVKHGYDTAEEIGLVDEATLTYRGGPEEKVWSKAIRALFESGDAAGAVDLVARHSKAQAAGKLPPGYPPQLGPLTLAAVTIGFVERGDIASAREWFGQTNAMRPHEDFYAAVIYACVRTIEKEDAHAAATLDLLNVVTREYMSRPDIVPDVPVLITVIDVNLVRIHFSSDPVEQRAAGTAVHTIITAKHRSGGVSVGTGCIRRAASMLGSHGQWQHALDLIRIFAIYVAQILRDGSSFRKSQVWSLQLLDPVAIFMGLTKNYDGPFDYPADSAPHPSVGAAAEVLYLLDGLMRTGSIKRWQWHTSRRMMDTRLVDLYLRQKGAAGGDVASLHLNHQQWLAILRSFAFVAESESKGVALPFSFPGFESVVDDFITSSPPFPADMDNEQMYLDIVSALRKTDIRQSRLVAILSILDPRVEGMVQSGLIPLGRSQPYIRPRSASLPPSRSSPPVSTSSTVPAPDPTVTASPPLPLINDPAIIEIRDRRADTILSPSSAPARPITPPAAPALYGSASASLATTSTPHEIHAPTTTNVERLLAAGDASAAVGWALQEAGRGRYTNPTVLARLIELLGRSRSTPQIYEVYALGYKTLPSLRNDVTAQVSAWVALEDAMIVALANADLLEQASTHRSRLIDNGSAPSADAYAALISNMRETTNDAAVALELFAESERLGVAPNVYLFNTLISKLSRARRAREALEYLELMKKLGLRPSSISYGAVINACCKAGDDVTADHLFSEMTQSPGFKPRVPPYNTMIQFYTQMKPSRERALFYYDQLLAAGIQPAGHTYKLLLDAYGSIGEPDVGSMNDVFQALLRDRSVKVEGPHWASIIHAWGAVVKDLGRAMATFDGIEHHAVTVRDQSALPDAVVYESLFNAFLVNNRPELCDRYVPHMARRGVRMSAYVANLLIKSHEQRGDIVSARCVFDAMVDPPTGAGAPGAHNRGAKSSSAVGNGAVYRQPSTWEAMIRAEISIGEAHRAGALFAGAEARGFPPAVLRGIRTLLVDAGIESLTL